MNKIDAFGAHGLAGRDRLLKLIDPMLPPLEELLPGLRAIEQNGIYSNYGPINTAFEEALERVIFKEGSCVTMANATCALALALKQASVRRPGRRYAVMPSFTFAATAHAALWAGLTPLLCDVDPVTWLACPDAEREIMAQYGEQVAAMLPCATFGYPFDNARYRTYEAEYGCLTVLDAAPALGTRVGGRQFTIGGGAATVFSLHATKTFATFEGGLIHATDPELIAELRGMGNFGFAAGSRSAVMPGFNTKLSEIIALVGLAQVDKLDGINAHRNRLAEEYRALLTDFTLQPEAEEAQAHMFLPMLLPRHLARERANIQARLSATGVGTGTYFSPHLAEQPYFQAECSFGALPVAQDVADRVLALPMHNRMDREDVHRVVYALFDACANL